MRFSSFSLVNKNNCSALSCIFIFFLILKKQVKLYFYFSFKAGSEPVPRRLPGVRAPTWRRQQELSHCGPDTDYRMADWTQIIAWPTGHRLSQGGGPDTDLFLTRSGSDLQNIRNRLTITVRLVLVLFSLLLPQNFLILSSKSNKHMF